MEKKRTQLVVGLMLVMAIFGISPIAAHFPPGTCIEHCLSECRLSGIGVTACFKYCPVHCLPPNTSTKERNCNLACMLDECAEFTNDEKRMTECVVKCRKLHCHINV